MQNLYSAALLVAVTLIARNQGALAGPITAVPWNGHTGAVSFTYDDARTSQIPTLLPQLDALKIKATFFISVTGAGGDFEQKKTQWIQASKNGHELANHTKAHGNMPADPSAAGVITEMADYLRALDPTVESLTFAYPNCNVNGKAGINAENIIARSCGQTAYAWGKEPTDWMNIQGLILTPTNVNTAITLLGSAKSSNSWVSTIVHDVKENPDPYSLTPSDNKKMLDAGVSNNLWIDTYLRVASYYRAHFTLDTVKAVKNASGWTLGWKSPHAKMPDSVMMLVKLDAATFGNDAVVRQEGKVLAPKADGNYEIDFMKLSLEVLEKSTGMISPVFLPKFLHARAMRNEIHFEGVVGEVLASVVDVQGKVLFQNRVSNSRIPLRQHQLKGVLFLTLLDPKTGNRIQALVNATR